MINTKYEIGKLKEKLTIWFVWKILPRYIVYWAMTRVAAHATTGRWGNQEVSSLKWIEMADRWNMKND